MPSERIEPSFRSAVPAGDDRERLVCNACGFVSYENPKIVVGSVVTRGAQILLCKRAIEPRKGFWTLPAGFLELNESPEDGAKREAREEAMAEIAIRALLAVYAIPHISQVQLMYLARLISDDVSAGPESEAVGLYDWDDIPWSDLAFPSVHWALNQFREVAGRDEFPPFGNPPGALGTRMPRMPST
ncbi:MAG: NUDIX hydrolase [Sphingomonadales bacterium]|nr:NUDIX hydrolase [Sphingomonadales bacterium]